MRFTGILSLSSRIRSSSLNAFMGNAKGPPYERDRKYERFRRSSIHVDNFFVALKFHNAFRKLIVFWKVYVMITRSTLRNPTESVGVLHVRSIVLLISRRLSIGVSGSATKSKEE